MTQAISTVLAATDLSRAAFAAVRRAALVARAHNARLEILHVMTQSFASQAWNDVRAAIGAIESDMRKSTEQNLEALVTQIESEIGIRANAALAEGKPYVAIVERGLAVDADLVVVGAHGENVLLTPLFSTTAHRVLREVRVPVLLVKQTPPGDRASKHQYERIVVATDFSDDAAHAARCARRLFPGAKVALVHVYEVPFEAKLSRTVAESSLTHYRELAAKHAASELEAFAVATGLHDAERVVRHGPAAIRVREFARNFDADLIAVGAQGHLLQSALLGSVSLHLVTEVQCDVLLGRAPRIAGD